MYYTLQSHNAENYIDQKHFEKIYYFASRTEIIPEEKREWVSFTVPQVRAVFINKHILSRHHNYQNFSYPIFAARTFHTYVCGSSSDFIYFSFM